MKIFRKGRLSQKEITAWLLDLRKNCYAPESGFYATCVMRAKLYGTDDYYFGGVNVENVDHRLSTHAEEACIAAMVAGLGPDAEIAEVWTMGALKKAKKSEGTSASCGKCRQQISSFAAKNAKVHSVSLSGKVSTTTVGAFLPHSFDFLKNHKKLSKTKAPSGMEIQLRLARKGKLSPDAIFQWLKKTPSADGISHVPQSVVLKLDNGAYVAGSKTEDVAFLSINAAQSAAAIAVSEFGPCKVKEAWVYSPRGLLMLSAMQTLLQLSAPKNMPITFFTGGGRAKRMTLMKAAAANG